MAWLKFLCLAIVIFNNSFFPRKIYSYTVLYGVLSNYVDKLIFFVVSLEQQIGVSSLKGAAEEFFLLHQTVENAQHLENFVRANDDQTQTLLGDRRFVHDAQNKVKQLERNATRLLELKRQLLDGHVTEEQLLEQGKSQLAKITVAKLQKRLEMLYFSVTRRTKEITSLAGEFCWGFL